MDRGPTRALPPLRPRAARIAGLGWRLVAAAVLLLALAGLWRGWVASYRIEPAFAARGLVVDAEDAARIMVGPRDAFVAGVPADGARLIAIDGTAVTSGEDAAARLAGDGPVRLKLEVAGKRTVVTLARNAALATAAAAGSGAPVVQFLALYALQFVAILGLLAGGLILAERRPDDPVSMLLAYAFAMGAAALPVTATALAWLGWYDFNDLATAGFFALFLVALPAFPDGRFVPRRGRWLALWAPVLFVLIVADALPLPVIASLSFVSTLVAGLMPVMRFRRTPPGIERQQLKWAGLGFTLAFAVLLAGAGLVMVGPEVGPWMALAGMMLFNLGFLMLPAGVLVSLMRYRLWDADRVTAKSGMVGIVTLTMGALWAAAQEVAKIAVAQIDPSFDATTLAALSTATVAILFPPVQSRIDRWTEARLEPRIGRLRALPEMLGTRAGRATSGQLAEAALAEAVEGAAAAGGTLSMERDGVAVPLAARGVPPGDDAFEVRGGEVLLRLAGRPDETPLPGGVRALLAALDAPLAEAFGAVLAREDQARAIAGLAARVDALAGQVAALSAGGASSARTSSMKRSTEIGLET
ncbi:hypothetical protein [uncultured Sphingomonas sp.]|uniref:hypothetical protein n=1 Tax=uncultured Sphingomonas sp. TaxID=158754 RepID=UPI0025EEE192|nr:hypothetical protein [uncultured Sphingomonas sp.]